MDGVPKGMGCAYRCYIYTACSLPARLRQLRHDVTIGVRSCSSRGIMPTLAQARRHKSLTQRQLADGVGVRPTLVSAWERGVYKPGLPNLKKLCEILEVTLEEIEFIPKPAKPITSKERTRQQIEAHNESMGYVDSTWLRGGRYDVDPAFHDPPSA